MLSRPGLRSLTHYWLNGQKLVQGRPVYVQPEVMRQSLISLLNMIEIGLVPEDFCLKFLVLDIDKDGRPQWMCFKKADKLDNTATSLANFNTKKAHELGKIESSWEEKCIVESVLAHLTRWSGKDTVDANLNPVPAGNRKVLCPQWLASWLETPQTDIKTMLQTAPVVTLEPGEWKNRIGVLKWLAEFAVSRKHAVKAVERHIPIPELYTATELQIRGPVEGPSNY